MKVFSIINSQGMQIKAPMKYTAYLLGWLKLKRLTVSDTDKDVKPQEIPCLMVGI